MNIFNKSQLLKKVPEISIYFWIIKLLSTAFGESTSDYLINAFNPYLVVILAALGFVIALALQFKMKRYIPWVYWLAVVMVAVFGTMAADVVHVVLGISYSISVIVFGIGLIGIFILWAKSEKSLSIHSITTFRREIFYWAAVSATFALGTAAGDLLAYSAHLGFFEAGVVFAVLFILVALSYFFFHFNETLAFWAAYILTRPLGASFADLAGKSTVQGGLGWGSGLVAMVLALCICIVVQIVSLHSQSEPQ